MGDESDINRDLSTKYSVDFEVPLDAYVYHLDPNEVPHESQSIAFTSITMECFRAIKSEYDPSNKKITIGAHMYGSKVFRKYFSDSKYDWDLKYQSTKSLFDYCDRSSDISSEFSERSFRNSYNTIAPTTKSYDNTRKLTSINSIFTELQEQYVDRFNLGSWVHRYALLLGLQQSDAITSTDRDNLEELCCHYERVMDEVLFEQDRIFRDTLNNVILNHWGLSNIPKGASRDVATLLKTIDILDDEFVELILENNGQVLSEYNRIKNGLGR